MAKVILQDVRCSFVFLNKPRKNSDGSDGKYSLQVLLNKDDTAQYTKIQKAVKATLIDKFGAQAWEKKAKYKLPLRDGDEEKDEEEYVNCYFFNANSGSRPGIVNRNNEPADQADLDEYCYSGAYFHVSVNFYAFDSKDGGKPGVAAGLNNVMLRKKGDRLDGSQSAQSEFSEFAEKDNSVDFDDDEF